MTLWSSESEQSPADSVLDFTQSLDVDYRLYPYDIEASIVWAEALAIAGAIPHSEFERIQSTLESIEQEFENGEFELDPELEDIHMNIEQELIDRLGDTGARIHYGRSRNDQIMVDVRLYLKDVIRECQQKLADLLQVLADRAGEQKETFLPGYTHLQPAQPIRLAHYLMAYFQGFRRDFERLDDLMPRVDVLPLGSAALAGSGVDIDREFLARELGFSSISQNSMDAVADRDFMVEAIQVFTQVALHASRLCEDWVIWSSPSVGFCEIDEQYTTGSSIMPQKQNPDVAELIRGHSGRLVGSLQGLINVVKGQPMAYNRDLQEDKVHLFSAIDSVLGWLPLFSDMIRTASFDEQSMEEALEKGYLGATDLADYLVEKGVPFREAHNAVRDVVHKAIQQDVTLSNLPLEEYLEVHDKFDPTIFEKLTPRESTKMRDLPGGTGPTAVTQQIDAARAWLKDHKENKES
ncbi:MAG: argininosuccinate lyase [bacterium]